MAPKKKENEKVIQKITFDAGVLAPLLQLENLDNIPDVNENAKINDTLKNLTKRVSEGEWSEDEQKKVKRELERSSVLAKFLSEKANVPKDDQTYGAVPNDVKQRILNGESILADLGINVDGMSDDDQKKFTKALVYLTTQDLGSAQYTFQKLILAAHPTLLQPADIRIKSITQNDDGQWTIEFTCELKDKLTAMNAEANAKMNGIQLSEEEKASFNGGTASMSMTLNEKGIWAPSHFELQVADDTLTLASKKLKSKQAVSTIEQSPKKELPRRSSKADDRDRSNNNQKSAHVRGKQKNNNNANLLPKQKPAMLLSFNSNFFSKDSLNEVSSYQSVRSLDPVKNSLQNLENQAATLFSQALYPEKSSINKIVESLIDQNDKDNESKLLEKLKVSGNKALLENLDRDFSRRTLSVLINFIKNNKMEISADFQKTLDFYNTAESIRTVDPKFAEHVLAIVKEFSTQFNITIEQALKFILGFIQGNEQLQGTSFIHEIYGLIAVFPSETSMLRINNELDVSLDNVVKEESSLYFSTQTGVCQNLLNEAFSSSVGYINSSASMNFQNSLVPFAVYSADLYLDQNKVHDKALPELVATCEYLASKFPEAIIFSEGFDLTQAYQQSKNLQNPLIEIAGTIDFINKLSLTLAPDYYAKMIASGMLKFIKGLQLNANHWKSANVQQIKVTETEGHLQIIVPITVQKEIDGRVETIEVSALRVSMAKNDSGQSYTVNQVSLEPISPDVSKEIHDEFVTKVEKAFNEPWIGIINFASPAKIFLCHFKNDSSQALITAVNAFEKSDQKNNGIIKEQLIKIIKGIMSGNNNALIKKIILHIDILEQMIGKDGVAICITKPAQIKASLLNRHAENGAEAVEDFLKKHVKVGQQFIQLRNIRDFLYNPYINDVAKKCIAKAIQKDVAQKMNGMNQKEVNTYLKSLDYKPKRGSKQSANEREFNYYIQRNEFLIEDVKEYAKAFIQPPVNTNKKATIMGKRDSSVKTQQTMNEQKRSTVEATIEKIKGGQRLDGLDITNILTTFGYKEGISGFHIIERNFFENELAKFITDTVIKIKNERDFPVICLYRDNSDFGDKCWRLVTFHKVEEQYEVSCRDPNNFHLNTGLIKESCQKALDGNVSFKVEEGQGVNIGGNLVDVGPKLDYWAVRYCLSALEIQHKSYSSMVDQRANRDNLDKALDQQLGSNEIISEVAALKTDSEVKEEEKKVVGEQDELGESKNSNKIDSQPVISSDKTELHTPKDSHVESFEENKNLVVEMPAVSNPLHSVSAYPASTNLNQLVKKLAANPQENYTVLHQVLKGELHKNKDFSDALTNRKGSSLQEKEKNLNLKNGINQQQALAAHLNYHAASENGLKGVRDYLMKNNPRTKRPVLDEWSGKDICEKILDNPGLTAEARGLAVNTIFQDDKLRAKLLDFSPVTIIRYYNKCAESITKEAKVAVFSDSELMHRVSKLAKDDPFLDPLFKEFKKDAVGLPINETKLAKAIVPVVNHTSEVSAYHTRESLSAVIKEIATNPQKNYELLHQILKGELHTNNAFKKIINKQQEGQLHFRTIVKNSITNEQAIAAHLNFHANETGLAGVRGYLNKGQEPAKSNERILESRSWLLGQIWSGKDIVEKIIENPYLTDNARDLAVNVIFQDDTFRKQLLDFSPATIVRFYNKYNKYLTEETKASVFSDPKLMLLVSESMKDNPLLVRQFAQFRKSFNEYSNAGLRILNSWSGKDICEKVLGNSNFSEQARGLLIDEIFKNNALRAELLRFSPRAVFNFYSKFNQYLSEGAKYAFFSDEVLLKAIRGLTVDQKPQENSLLREQINKFNKDFEEFKEVKRFVNDYFGYMGDGNVAFKREFSTNKDKMEKISKLDNEDSRRILFDLEHVHSLGGKDKVDTPPKDVLPDLEFGSNVQKEYQDFFENLKNPVSERDAEKIQEYINYVYRAATPEGFKILQAANFEQRAALLNFFNVAKNKMHDIGYEYINPRNGAKVSAYLNFCYAELEIRLKFLGRFPVAAITSENIEALQGELQEIKKLHDKFNGASNIEPLNARIEYYENKLNKKQQSLLNSKSTQTDSLIVSKVEENVSSKEENIEENVSSIKEIVEVQEKLNVSEELGVAEKDERQIKENQAWIYFPAELEIDSNSGLAEKITKNKEELANDDIIKVMQSLGYKDGKDYFVIGQTQDDPQVLNTFITGVVQELEINSQVACFYRIHRDEHWILLTFNKDEHGLISVRYEDSKAPNPNEGDGSDQDRKNTYNARLKNITEQCQNVLGDYYRYNDFIKNVEHDNQQTPTDGISCGAWAVANYARANLGAEDGEFYVARQQIGESQNTDGLLGNMSQVIKDSQKIEVQVDNENPGEQPAQKIEEEKRGNWQAGSPLPPPITPEQLVAMLGENANQYQPPTQSILEQWDNKQKIQSVEGVTILPPPNAQGAQDMKTYEEYVRDLGEEDQDALINLNALLGGIKEIDPEKTNLEKIKEKGGKNVTPSTVKGGSLFEPNKHTTDISSSVPHLGSVDKDE